MSTVEKMHQILAPKTRIFCKKLQEPVISCNAFFKGASNNVRDKHGGWSDKHCYYIIVPDNNSRQPGSYDFYNGLISISTKCTESICADVIAHETLHKILHGIIGCEAGDKLDNIRGAI